LQSPQSESAKRVCKASPQSKAITQSKYSKQVPKIQKIFTQNFLGHYTKSKAPFPLFFHLAWFFNRPHRQEGFFAFLDSILALPDVYFVTSQELINWVRNIFDSVTKPFNANSVFQYSPLQPIIDCYQCRLRLRP
jgi:hypothetical protein